MGIEPPRPPAVRDSIPWSAPLTPTSSSATELSWGHHLPESIMYHGMNTYKESLSKANQVNVISPVTIKNKCYKLMV